MTPADAERLEQIRRHGVADYRPDAAFLLTVIDQFRQDAIDLQVALTAARADVAHGQALVRDLVEEKGLEPVRAAGFVEAIERAAAIVETDSELLTAQEGQGVFAPHRTVATFRRLSRKIRALAERIRSDNTQT